MGISHLLNQYRVIWYEKSNIKMKVNILAFKKKIYVQASEKRTGYLISDIGKQATNQKKIKMNPI